MERAGQELATKAAIAQQTAEGLAPTLQAQGGELRQTAEALAPTLEAQAPGLRQTLETLAPTLQAQAPELRQTLEALAPTLEAQAPELRQTAEALGGGAAPDDIPLAEPRRQLLSSDTRVVYTTDVPFEGVVELYRGEMPAAGWLLLPDSFQNSDFARLRYSKQGGRTATVTIAPSPEGTLVDVVVMSDS